MESRGSVSALTESGLRHVPEKLPAAAYACDPEGQCRSIILAVGDYLRVAKPERVFSFAVK